MHLNKNVDSKTHHQIQSEIFKNTHSKPVQKQAKLHHSSHPSNVEHIEKTFSGETTETSLTSEITESETEFYEGDLDTQKQEPSTIDKSISPDMEITSKKHPSKHEPGKKHHHKQKHESPYPPNKPQSAPLPKIGVGNPTKRSRSEDPLIRQKNLPKKHSKSASINADNHEPNDNIHEPSSKHSTKKSRDDKPQGKQMPEKSSKHSPDPKKPRNTHDELFGQDDEEDAALKKEKGPVKVAYRKPGGDKNNPIGRNTVTDNKFWGFTSTRHIDRKPDIKMPHLYSMDVAASPRVKDTLVEDNINAVTVIPEVTNLHSHNIPDPYNTVPIPLASEIDQVVGVGGSSRKSLVRMPVKATPYTNEPPHGLRVT